MFALSILPRRLPQALAVLLLSAGAGSAAAQTHYQTAQALCRISIGSSTRDLAAEAALRIGACHRLRLKGDLAASVDCNAPSTWQAGGYPDGAAAMARDLARFEAQAAECAPGISTPDEVGFATCPAPCDALPMTTFAEVGACIQCLNTATALPALTTIHGTPPTPATREPRKCLEVIARGAVRYINQRMKHQHDCQFLQDSGGLMGVDCADTHNPNHPYYTRDQRSVDKLRNQIAKRCATINIPATLDTCGTEPTSVHTCVTSLIDQWTDVLKVALYPPLP